MATSEANAETSSAATNTSSATSEIPVPTIGEGDIIVELTELAAEKVKEIRASEEIESDLSLRLRVVGGGCAGFSYDLYFDEKTPMDKSFEYHGVQIIADQMSMMYLIGTTIDYVEGLQGAGFKFNNPNVKATCGCGSSFSV